jgi:hypothetical protein
LVGRWIRTFISYEILRRNAVSPSADKYVVSDDVSAYREEVRDSCITRESGTHDIASVHVRPAARVLV